MKQALLIVDVQNDYFPQGKMELVGAESALSVIQQLQQHFKQRHLPIIYIQHIAPQDAAFFQEGSNGAELHPELLVSSESIIIRKHAPNSFYETTLQQILSEHGVQQLVITGMMTHMCIDSTTRAAKELGFQPILIADATATRTLEWQGKTVDATQVQLTFLHALSWFAHIETATNYLQQN